MKILNRTYPLAILILIANVAFSEPIDSLLTRLPIVNGKEKVKLLTEICTGYREIAPRKGLDYGRSGLDLAQKIDDEFGESEILDAMAFNCIVLGMYDSTIYFSTYSQKIDEKIENKQGLAQSFNNIGVAYYFTSNYTQSLSNHIQALHLREVLHDSVGLSRSYNNIGLVYLAIDAYEDALVYFNKSLVLKRKLNDQFGIVRTIENIGETYYRSGDIQQAKRYHEEALILCRKIGYGPGTALADLNLGQTYIRIGEHEKALKFLYEAIPLYEKVENRGGITESWNLIGLAYSKMGKYDRAIREINKALKIGKSINALNHIKDSYKYLSGIYEQQGKQKLALENYKMYETIKDSVFSVNNMKKIATMEFKWQIENQENENQIRIKDQQIKDLVVKRGKIIKNAIIGILSMLLIALIILHNRYRLKMKTMEEISQLQELLPICSNCKSIRDDSGYWHQVEEYFKDHSGAVFTHGICPDCAKKLYPDYYSKMFEKELKDEQLT
ncbi:MAG: tetratricopeptide repeat protein [Candidatus Marinimicrobia bacterium]|nr:tetratricopeptide repeat protein [Candidatus Neomarinimicrobiota bacterium]